MNALWTLLPLAASRTSFAMYHFRSRSPPPSVNVTHIPHIHDQYLKGKLHAKPENPAKYAHDVELNNLISLWKGDITTLEIDAIVNAANRSMLGGGGVDGAIHSAAGHKLYQECKKLGPCDTGDAKITQGYKLPAKHIIHTVGPMRTDEKALQSCYIRSLEVLTDKGLRTTAFPCISTGIYGYPNDEAANAALSVVREWLETKDNRKKVDRIIFCLFMPEDVKLYRDLTPIYFPPAEKDGDETDAISRFETKIETAPSDTEHEREATTSVHFSPAKEDGDETGIITSSETQVETTSSDTDHEREATSVHFSPTKEDGDKTGIITSSETQIETTSSDTDHEREATSVHFSPTKEDGDETGIITSSETQIETTSSDIEHKREATTVYLPPTEEGSDETGTIARFETKAEMASSDTERKHEETPIYFPSAKEDSDEITLGTVSSDTEHRREAEADTDTAMDIDVDDLKHKP